MQQFFIELFTFLPTMDINPNIDLGLVSTDHLQYPPGQSNTLLLY